MFYVKRDEKNQIVALYSKSTDDAIEALPDDHPDVQTFLAGASGAQKPLAKLEESDRQMIRVIEDLIEILIEKNVINFTDLPDATQGKILTRKAIRQRLSEIL